MIEFELGRTRNGKRYRWTKKFPRNKILHRGDEKSAYWFKNNWIDDNYIYFKGDLDKFLMSNVGKPVDKVFSEFLKRCRRGTEKYNLRKWFYDMFEEKSDIDYHGGFYITSGILNYKKRTEKPKLRSYVSVVDYNRQIMPDIAPLCKECESTHTKQLVGEFKLSYKVQKRVYLIEREIWLSDLELQAHYRLCSIYGIGKGVHKYVWDSQDKMYKVSYEVWDRDSYSWSELPEFVFITKIEKI